MTTSLFRCVNSTFFPAEYVATPPRMRHNIEELFAVIKEHHATEELSVKVNVQHDGLRPTLRPYQKRAVSWMLHQEGFGQKKIFEGKKPGVTLKYLVKSGRLLHVHFRVNEMSQRVNYLDSR